MTKFQIIKKLSLDFHNCEFDSCLSFVRQRRDLAKGGFFVI